MAIKRSEKFKVLRKINERINLNVTTQYGIACSSWGKAQQAHMSADEQDREDGTETEKWKMHVLNSWTPNSCSWI